MPEPSEQPSSLRQTPAPSRPASPSSHNKPAESTSLPNDATAIINKLVSELPLLDDDAPTIISSTRHKLPSPDAQHAESLVGRKLGHFELIESVGIGGMAAVIKAQDLELGRTVALKILPPDMAADPENITRFKHEARAAAKLDHENIARVYFCGEDQGLHFIAFEFVEGENLRVKMEKSGGLLQVADSLRYLIQVTAGLSHAASRGVVHRDIKPSNIIVTPEGKAKIVDMGLARNLDARTSNGQLTQSGVTLGTFDYISPEQAIEPRLADCRSDIYSLGCTFYHVLTGHVPVPEGTAAKKLHCHQHVAPLDPRELNPAIPDELAAILARMMAKDPAHRYQHPDHLLQHLLIVADKLKIPTGPVATDDGGRVSPYVDQPLPEPPGLSPLWIGLGIAVLVIGLFVITGGFGGKAPLDSQSFWQNEKPGKDPTAAGGTNPNAGGNLAEAPFVQKGPREAKSTAEFVALLKQPTAHIKLRAGVTYDLTRLGKTDTELPHALFEGSELALESDRLLDPPTVRLTMSAIDDGKLSRLGSLTIRGPADGSPAKVRFRGIRFEFVAPRPEAGQAGIQLFNVDQVEVDDCSFTPPLRRGEPLDGPAAVAILHDLTKETAPEAAFSRCYFAPGCVALQMQAGIQMRLAECAFAPQFAAVRVQNIAGTESRSPAIVRLESCSLLAYGGAVVEIADQVPCKVRAGRCLFSDPEEIDGEPTRSVVIRQLGAIAAETDYEGLKGEDASLPLPNGYHRVLAYGNGEMKLSFEDCKREQIPVGDSAARLLTKPPWEIKQPIARLFDNPLRFRSCFAASMDLDTLRLEPDRNRNILGTMNLLGSKVYSLYPFQSVTPDNRLAANEKVWEPGYPETKTLPANVYRSLAKAILDLKKGDVLLIRHNGPLEVDPAEFRQPDTDVTIRADENCRPILIPRAPTLKKDHALFKLYGGQIVLENLRFLLKPDRAPAVVALPGSGLCVLRNCSATLEQSDELSIVSLADPRGEMMMMGMANVEKWPSPRIVIENTFIRGRGKVLGVLGSRPFELRLKNDLVVLDGSLVAVDSSQADLSEASPAQVTIDRTTTYLTRHLLFMKAGEKKPEGKGLGLVPVHFHCSQNLFVPASETASLVYLDRIDTMEQMESIFAWRDCKQNVYGFKADQEMLHVQPENPDTTTRPERIDRDRWLGKWREADYAFGEVNFSVVPATRRFDGVKPGDFEVKSINPPLKAEDPSEFGAPIDALRKLAIEE